MLLLHPLPSSWMQGEVRRGQGSSSLCHYPSITCRSLWVDTKLSPLCFDTLLSLCCPHHSFFPLVFWNHSYDFHIPPPLTPSAPWFSPVWAFYLCLTALLIAWLPSQFPSVIFLHVHREPRGPFGCEICWVCSGSIDWIKPAVSNFTEILEEDTHSYRKDIQLSWFFLAKGERDQHRLNACKKKKYSLILGQKVMQYRCYVIINVSQRTTMLCSRIMHGYWLKGAAKVILVSVSHKLKFKYLLPFRGKRTNKKHAASKLMFYVYFLAQLFNISAKSVSIDVHVSCKLQMSISLALMF